MADNSEEAPKPEEESTESSGENAPPAEDVVAGEEEPPPEQPEEPENVENVEKPETAEDAEVEVEPSKVADEVESPEKAAAAEDDVAATEEEAKPDAGEEGVEGEGTGEPSADEVIRVHEEKEEVPKEVEAGEETGYVESERQDDEEQVSYSYCSTGCFLILNGQFRLFSSPLFAVCQKANTKFRNCPI